MRKSSTLVLLLVSLGMIGCAAQSNIAIKPWERGNLGRVEMAWSPDPMESAMRDHTFFSKEASSGGGSASGGGCGCN